MLAEVGKKVMRPYQLGLLAMALAISLPAGCVSAQQSHNSVDRKYTTQELDQKVIEDMTEGIGKVDGDNYSGISGRIVELIILAVTEMKNVHAARCGAEPLATHLFFYSERNEVVVIRTMPRFVAAHPQIPAPAPAGYKRVTREELFPNLPAGARSLDGCEIEFEVAKSSKEIVTTKIIR